VKQKMARFFEQDRRLIHPTQEYPICNRDASKTLHVIKIKLMIEGATRSLFIDPRWDVIESATTTNTLTLHYRLSNAETAWRCTE
jgi:hypothetical protein